MKNKLKMVLALSASVLGITALTGCTKDDIADLQSQITALQDELNDLKAQIKALQDQMASEIKAVKDDYSAKIETINAKIAENQEKIAKLKEDLEAAKKELSEKHENDISDLKDYIDNKVATLEERISKDEAELASLKQKHDSDLATAKADYDAKIAALSDKTKEDLATAKKEMQDDYDRKIADLKSDYDKKLADLQADYDKKIADLESGLSDCSSSISELKTQHEKDKKALEEDYNGKLADLKSDYESKIQTLSDKAASDLATTKDEIKEEYDKKIAELKADYESKCATLESSISSCRSSIDELKAQEEKDKKALEDDYNGKISTLQSAYEAKASSIESEILALKGEISFLKDEMAEKIEKIQSDYNDKIDGLTTRVTSLENEDRSTLLRGHGVPLDTLGKDGDSYVDLDNWDYYVKENGSWSRSGNFKGNDAITYVPCIFKNYDGTKIYEFYYEKGSDIVYDGPTPEKPSETIDGYAVDWTFSGWDKPLTNIQAPTIFTAQFESLKDCTFKNYDGTILYKTSVNFGESVDYKGETPTKPDTVSGDQTLVWTFDGWDKSLDSIKEDTVFTAKFYAPNAIKCTFVNYDGTELYTAYCGNGDRAEYQGDKPTKPSVDDGNGTLTSYTFSGWDKSLKNITEDATFTAQYGENASYLCTFKNYDGTKLHESYVFKGGQAEYLGDTPERDQEADGTSITDYTFQNWDKTLSNISSPTVFTANYSVRTFTGHKVTFMDGDKTLYSHYFKDGTDASYPYEMAFSYDDTNVTLFLGWDKSIKNISEDIVTNAVTKTITRHQNGEYPQTKVADAKLTSEIKSDGTIDKQGYYAYEGDRYCYYDASFYKVEPIKWRFLENGDGTALMMSDVILNAHRYNGSYDGLKDGFYANNYKNSEIRSWLNSDFLDQAFYYDDSLIATTEVDNSVATTGYSSNPYVCENTNDKVFLPSYADLTNGNYGFTSYADRKCKATDYAEARGAYTTTDGHGYYWTRSPNYYDSRYVWYVPADGDLHYGNHVDSSVNGVRPSLSLKVS